AVDVQPDVKLGPVRQRKHADALSRTLAAVVHPPQLWPLLFGIPPMLGGSKREHSLLGARLLLVPAGPSERRVEPMLLQRLLETLRLPQVCVQSGPMLERVDPSRD